MLKLHLRTAPWRCKIRGGGRLQRFVLPRWPPCWDSSWPRRRWRTSCGKLMLWVTSWKYKIETSGRRSDPQNSGEQLLSLRDSAFRHSMKQFALWSDLWFLGWQRETGLWWICQNVIERRLSDLLWMKIKWKSKDLISFHLRTISFDGNLFQKWKRKALILFHLKTTSFNGTLFLTLLSTTILHEGQVVYKQSYMFTQ